MPQVTIVVPVYNVEKYLTKCIESIIAQTVEDWELILVDDGSTDSSFTISRKYSEKDMRIRAIENGHRGVSAARNTGISLARSENIMFIDSDDTIEPNALELLLSAINDSDFVLASYKTVYLNGVVLEHDIPAYTGDIRGFCHKIDVYLGQAIIQGPCWKIFKKAIIEKYDIKFPENIDFGEDACFVYTYLKYVEYVNVISDMIYLYYVYEKSLSHGFREDKYRINLMLNEMLAEVLDYFGIENVIAKKHELNRGAFSAYLNDCALCSNWHYAKKMLKKAVELESTYKAYAMNNELTVKQRVVRNLVIGRKYTLLLMFAKCNKIITRK